jgi:hypothetical protein
MPIINMADMVQETEQTIYILLLKKVTQNLGNKLEQNLGNKLERNLGNKLERNLGGKPRK